MSRQKAFENSDFMDVVLKVPGSTTMEISDLVGCNHRTALIRLKEIKSEMKIIGNKKGSVWIWYPSPNLSVSDLL